MEEQSPGNALRPAWEPLGGNDNTAFLKVLALVFMLCDHTGAIFFRDINLFRILGRMALPLYSWCIVVGCTRTRNMPLYAFRLLLMAAVSQPLYMMALNHTWKDLNIVFLLFLAVLVIWGLREKWLGSQFWAPVLAYVLLAFVKVDYGWKGLTFILLLYAARQTRSGLAAAFIAFALFWGSTSQSVSSVLNVPLVFLDWNGVGPILQNVFKLQTMCLLALPLVLIPTHVQIRMPKWLGYGLYPLHLVVLIAARVICGTGWNIIFRGF